MWIIWMASISLFDLFLPESDKSKFITMQREASNTHKYGNHKTTTKLTAFV